MLKGIDVPKDYQPMLDGPGETDYARYMQTDTLLALQRRPEEMLHRDELLFQTVHQSTELWLKHACYEVSDAAERVRADDLEGAGLLLGRASFGIELITAQLEMLKFMEPWHFQLVRPALGNGSGFESPGWLGVKRVSERLWQVFEALLGERGIELFELYQSLDPRPVYRLAEAMVEWDERVSLWRARHYKVAVRTIGHGTVGTKGTPVDHLGKLLNHKYFPPLWEVRSRLAQAGPLVADNPRTAVG